MSQETGDHSKVSRTNTSIFDLSTKYLSGATLSTGSKSVAIDVELPPVIPATEPESKQKPLDDGDELDSHPPEEEERFSCNTCQVVFDTNEDQRNHFRSDWHRLNVKRCLACRPIVTEEAFEAALENPDKDELESISGSDSENDENERSHHSGGKTDARVGFFDEDGKYFTMWRCVLQSERELQGTAAEGGGEAYLRALQGTSRCKGRWVVILASGGHFAGAVFDWRKDPKRKPGEPPAVIAHRTFHRYVVRQGQGGRQSTKDGGGKKIKSAGSNLRRYNEQALTRDIRELVMSWQELIGSAELLFIQANGANGVPIFGGDQPLLSRDDPRMRRVPFNTRRPTFSEVQRVAYTLGQVTYQTPPSPTDQAPPTHTTSSKRADSGTGSSSAQHDYLAEDERRAQKEMEERAAREAAKKEREKEKKKAKKKEKQMQAAAAAAAGENLGNEGAGAGVVESPANNVKSEEVVAAACAKATGGAGVLQRLRASKKEKEVAKVQSEREMRAAAAEKRFAAMSMGK